MSGNGVGGRVGDAVVTASVDLASTSIRPIIVADVIVLRFFLVLPRQFVCGTVAGIVAWPWCCSRCVICVAIWLNPWMARKQNQTKN